MRSTDPNVQAAVKERVAQAPPLSPQAQDIIAAAFSGAFPKKGKR